MTEQDENQLIRYVLDDLPANERELVEERYFKDDDYYEALLAIEAETVRDWVAGALPAARALRFEARLKQDAKLRERVSMVEVVSGRWRSEPAAKSRRPVFLPLRLNWMRVALAGVAALLVGALGLIVQRASNRIDLLQTRFDAAQRPIVVDRSGPFNPTFSLSAGETRGRDARSPLYIPPEASAVKLQLFIPEHDTPVRIVLRRADSSAETWSISRDNLGKVEIEIPAGLLNRGDYELRALTSSGQEIDSWAFRIMR